jgi:hypothetical protein
LIEGLVVSDNGERQIRIRVMGSGAVKNDISLSVLPTRVPRLGGHFGDGHTFSARPSITIWLMRQAWRKPELEPLDAEEASVALKLYQLLIAGYQKLACGTAPTVETIATFTRGIRSS